MPYIILIAGLYLLFIGFLMSTKDITSFLIFKFFPFLLGLVLVFHAVKSLGWLALL